MPKSKPAKKQKPLSLTKQFEFMRNAMIGSWLALLPEHRANFLRQRIGICSSAL
jgi:hypothetical protein